MSALVFSACLAMLLLLGDGVPSNLLSTFILAGAAGYQAVRRAFPGTGVRKAALSA